MLNYTTESLRTASRPAPASRFEMITGIKKYQRGSQRGTVSQKNCVDGAFVAYNGHIQAPKGQAAI